MSVSLSVYSLSRLFGVDAELSLVARQGSGSACRSMYGGFVQWKMGERQDGKDSVAEQVAPETHWPELRVLVLVVSHIGPLDLSYSFLFSVFWSLLSNRRRIDMEFASRCCYWIVQLLNTLHTIYACSYIIFLEDPEGGRVTGIKSPLIQVKMSWTQSLI